MTEIAASAYDARSREAPPTPVWRTYRFELVKLLAQWPVRLVLLACLIAPALFVVAVSSQGSLPSDTVFGRWMGQSGWAGALVILSFACSWLLPLLTSLVAGDVFASEDRLGTWRHLLVAVRSPRRIFGAKALASLTVILLLAVGLALSSIVGGLVSVGSHPLVGLDGHSLSAGSAAGMVLLAWLVALVPTLAFAAVGLLGSVTLGRSPMGLVMPLALALILNIAQLAPLPVIVRVALPSYSFIAWRGLFVDPSLTGPLLAGLLVDVAWIGLAAWLAYRLFMRRDFTDLAYDGMGRRVVVQGLIPLGALLAISVGVIAAVTSASGSGIDKPKLERSLAVSFGHLYVMQTRELHRPHVTEAQLQDHANCNKGGGGPATTSTGAGNDWRCVVKWRLPGTKAVGSAIYQLDVTPDGRFVADGDGPNEVNGFFQVRTPQGNASNPLWQFDGLVNLITS